MINRRHFLSTTAAGVAAYGLGLGASRAQEVPAGYPADYGGLIEASKSEGQLLFYSGTSNEGMSPIFKGFNKLYPWVNVQHLDVGAGAMIERYLSEIATNTDTASLLFGSAGADWLRLTDRDQLLEYHSPEYAAFPKADVPHSGMHQICNDPVGFVWNKLLLPEDKRPTGLADLVEKVSADPDFFDGKISALSAELAPSGYNFAWYVAEHHGDKIWDWFKVLGPRSRFERAGGVVLEKVMSGEYIIGYLQSSQATFQALQKPGVDQVIGWGLIHDGTQFNPKEVAVTVAGKSPSSAKLLLDYLLTRQGQIDFAATGSVVSRLDLTKEDVNGQATLGEIKAEVGEPNLIYANFDRRRLTDHDAFVARWKEANGA